MLMWESASGDFSLYVVGAPVPELFESTIPAVYETLLAHIASYRSWHILPHILPRRISLIGGLDAIWKISSGPGLRKSMTDLLRSVSSGIHTASCVSQPRSANP